MSKNDLVERLRKRAEIRRNISTRKSVQNNEPDRIADLLEEAANALEKKDGETELLEAQSNEDDIIRKNLRAENQKLMVQISQLLDYTKANSIGEVVEMIEELREK